MTPRDNKLWKEPLKLEIKVAEEIEVGVDSGNSQKLLPVGDKLWLMK